MAMALIGITIKRVCDTVSTLNPGKTNRS